MATSSPVPLPPSQQQQQQKTEPVSILKSSTHSKSPSENMSVSMGKATRIVLSEDEEEDEDDDDEEEEDIQGIPISGQALELLQTEKSVKSGYLLKKGEKRRTWKKRWFVLRTTKLAMYKDSKEYKLLRIIDLHEVHSVVHVTSRNKYKYMFAISTPKRMYYLQADNQHELDNWIAAIQQTKSELALYDADDDESLVGRDQAFAKDIVSSYKSTHSSSSHPNNKQPTSPTFSQQRRRQSSSSATSSFQLDKRSSTSHHNMASSPVDIPKRQHRPEPFQINTTHLVGSTASSSSLEHQQQQQHPGLSSYVTGQTYPLSPVSDHQAQMHVADALASSEDDDDEYSWTEDMANVQQEENRNRVLIDGYLLKLGRNKGWRKRWFVLRTDTLAYYEDDKEYAPHRIIPLTHIIDSLEIEPISKNKKYCFKIVIPKRSYILCASSEMELESWLNALSIAVRRAKSDATNITSPTGATTMTHHHHHSPITPSTTTTTPLSPITSPSKTSSQHHSLHLREFPTNSSFDSFENSSHFSGSGGVGGAGGVLPSRAHKLGRAK